MSRRGFRTLRFRVPIFVSAALALALPATASASQALAVTTTGSGAGTVTSSPSGIDCGATCSFGFADNAVVTLSGAAGANTKVVAWTGCEFVNLENQCNVTLSAAKAVTATFDLMQVQLKVTEAGPGTGILIGTGPGVVTSSPSGISCGVTCASDFGQGSTIILTAAEGLESELVQWSGCDKVAGNRCEVMMSAARAVTATYDVKPLFSLYTVSIVKAGTGFGTVTSSPSGIDCGSSCTAEVLSTFAPTLTAVPAEGSIFAHWSGGGCSGSGPCEKPVETSHTVKAIFTAVGVRMLALTIGGTGTGIVKSKAVGIECSVSCSPLIAAGTKVALTAVAGSGSTFAGFSGECSGTKVCKVQMSEAHNVMATFVKTPVPLPPGGVVIARVAKVKGGKALVGVRCVGPASCRGSLRLLAKLDKGKKRLPIGSATFSLAPGSSTVLKVKLSVKAKQALKSKGRLKAKGMGAGIQAQTIQLTLWSRNRAESR